jgi:hypothetical protein
VAPPSPRNYRIEADFPEERIALQAGISVTLPERSNLQSSDILFPGRFATRASLT